MRRFLSLAILALAVACISPPDGNNRYSPFADLYEEARFRSAQLLDATRMVFSWSDGAYHYVDGNALWGRGRREYLRDAKVLAIYDLATGEGRILRHEQRTTAGDGNGNYAVLAARGDTALLFKDRETENGTLVDAGGMSLLDLSTGELTDFDPRAELATFGLRSRSSPRLVHPSGILLYEAYDPEDNPRRLEAFSFFLRRNDGSLQELGLATFSGEIDGRVYLRRTAREGQDELDVVTGKIRELSNAEFAPISRRMLAPRIPALVRIVDEGARIQYEEQVGDDWAKRPLEIDVMRLSDHR